jgi:hypothetical protein
LSQQVTCSRSLSASQAPPEASYPDQESRSLSRPSSSETLVVADSTGPSVWSIGDSVDEAGFASSIDNTSTKELRQANPSMLLPIVQQTYSPNDFDQTRLLHLAIEMSKDESPE